MKQVMLPSSSLTSFVDPEVSVTSSQEITPRAFPTFVKAAIALSM
jgi:hypothetical protein